MSLPLSPSGQLLNLGVLSYVPHSPDLRHFYLFFCLFISCLLQSSREGHSNYHVQQPRFCPLPGNLREGSCSNDREQALPPIFKSWGSTQPRGAAREKCVLPRSPASPWSALGEEALRSPHLRTRPRSLGCGRVPLPVP